MINLEGLCHICFKSGVKLHLSKGQILCSECLEKINAKN